MKLGFRLTIFYLALLATFLVLLGRLLSLQIIQGSYFRSLAEGNRARVSSKPAPRGIIYDRKGWPLVRNVPGYKIKVSDGQYQRISREEALKIESKGGSEAANLEMDILREYLYPKEFAHTLGYLGEASQEEIQNLELGQSYKSGELIGKIGIEQSYEKDLRGKEGQELVETDATGNKLRVLGEIDPVPGEDLTLTLDLDLQKAAYEVLGDVKGAIVVQNPKNGEILALVSRPSFNPNDFSFNKKAEIDKTLQDQTNLPLFNRVIGGTYPPGSTFKIITASAGLEEGKLTKTTQVEDVGEIVIGPYRFPNWYLIQYGKTEGSLNIVGAIRRSNDIFFYKVAEWLGEDSLGRWAKKFNLGKPLGIDIAGEAAGLVPDSSWKEKTIGDHWYLGDTYHFGIGQGYLLTTPLQVNSWTSVIANGGTIFKPHLTKDQKPEVEEANFLKKENIDLIHEGMDEACATGGTGWPLFDFKIQNPDLNIDDKNFFAPKEATTSGNTNGWVGIPVACKTGTAEFGEPKNKTHAWFTAFAPIADPEIVVTVLVEGGGEGSSTGGPIAKKIFEEWFRMR